jgi:uncharacterized membrane protein (UPF0127 family)
MRKILLSLFLLIALNQNLANAGQSTVKFIGSKDALVQLEVASTSDEKSKGLMNVSSLPENHGMVFVFKPAQKVTFWMKDTLIPLDMIFIRKGKIVKIIKNATPNQTQILYPSDFEVTEVVEVNGGYSARHKLSVGNKVLFKNILTSKTNG